MFEVGRICIKIAGRDAGREAIIVDILDGNYVLIDGNVRRKKKRIIGIKIYFFGCLGFSFFLVARNTKAIRIIMIITASMYHSRLSSSDSSSSSPSSVSSTGGSGSV